MREKYCDRLNNSDYIVIKVSTHIKMRSKILKYIITNKLQASVDQIEISSKI